MYLGTDTTMRCCTATRDRTHVIRYLTLTLILILTLAVALSLISITLTQDPWDSIQITVRHGLTPRHLLTWWTHMI